MTDPRQQLAQDLFDQAYALQLQGDVETAMQLYRRSIELFPTAEAHTFLGWAYSFRGLMDDAIRECKTAIGLDPSYGNPYNDIGAYLIGQKKFDEAIPWLEKALASKRYDAYHYPWYNLGRVYAAKEMYNRAMECFRKSLEVLPDYKLAKDALNAIRKTLQ